MIIKNILTLNSMFVPKRQNKGRRQLKITFRPIFYSSGRNYLNSE